MLCCFVFLFLGGLWMNFFNSFYEKCWRLSFTFCYKTMAMSSFCPQHTVFAFSCFKPFCLLTCKILIDHDLLVFVAASLHILYFRLETCRRSQMSSSDRNLQHSLNFMPCIRYGNLFFFFTFCLLVKFLYFFFLFKMTCLRAKRNLVYWCDVIA